MKVRVAVLFLYLVLSSRLVLPLEEMLDSEAQRRRGSRTLLLNCFRCSIITQPLEKPKHNHNPFRFSYIHDTLEQLSNTL